MTAQDLIQALKSATVDELAHVRSLLKIPEISEYIRHSCQHEDMPRNLGDLWNRREQPANHK